MSNAPFDPFFRTPLNPQELLKDFNVLRADVLLDDLSGFPVYESIADQARHYFFSSEDTPEVVLFVSHRWNCSHNPDPKGEQFTAIVTFLRYLQRISALSERSKLQRIWDYLCSTISSRSLAMTYGAFQAAYFLSEYNRFDANNTNPALLDMSSKEMLRKIGVWYDFTCMPQDSTNTADLISSLERLHELLGASNLLSLRKPGDGYDERAWCAAEVATDPDIERSNFKKICLRLDLLEETISDSLFSEGFAQTIGAPQLLQQQLKRARDGASIARAVGFFVRSVGVDFEDDYDPPMLFVKRKPWIFTGQREFMSLMIDALSDASSTCEESSNEISIDLAALATKAAVLAGLKSSNPEDLTYTALLILYARHRGAPDMASMYADALRRHLNGLSTTLDMFKFDYHETNDAETTVRIQTGKCNFSFADTHATSPEISPPRTNRDGIAVYVRTTTSTDAYDNYPFELIEYCRKQGWSEPQVYHDLFMEISLHGSSDNRYYLDRLLFDLARGEFRTVVIHDLGQLGKLRWDAWTVLANIMEYADVHVPRLGKVNLESRIPGSSGPAPWADAWNQ